MFRHLGKSFAKLKGMKNTKLDNGFYWIILKDETDDPEENTEPEVAEFCDSVWKVAGSSKDFAPEEYDVTLLSVQLVPPKKR